MQQLNREGHLNRHEKKKSNMILSPKSELSRRFMGDLESGGRNLFIPLAMVAVMF